MIMSTSLVSLAAPISLEPSATILIFFACDNGAAISAATYIENHIVRYYV